MRSISRFRGLGVADRVARADLGAGAEGKTHAFPDGVHRLVFLALKE